MAPRWCVYIAHRWRLPKLQYALFILEIPLTITLLVLFSIADTDNYRNRLWQNGSDRGFNSNPNEILYSYANYQPIDVPLIWSSFMTKFNVVIAVLGTFILLVKSVMFVLHAFLPILSILVHALLIALYAVAVSNQSTPDLSNKNVPHLSKNLPWYLSKGCSYAAPKNYGYCMQARASFGVTCVMLALFVVFFAFAVWSAIITKAEKDEREAERQDDIELKTARYMSYDPDTGLTQEEKWERNRQLFMNMPKTPNTPGGQYGRMNPMTPRTTAFTQLSGEQPQPQRTASGGSGPSRPLVLRQYSEGRVPDAR